MYILQRNGPDGRAWKQVRKVRAPQGRVPGNARWPVRRLRKVQQKIYRLRFSGGKVEMAG